MILTEKKETYAPDWWKNQVVYQIYPRSFCDSNADGIGDLQGIISKLDYLQRLGVGILWLSPVYLSPMDDNGYDISDYYQIAEEYGSMDDMEMLIRQAELRGMRILMDLVANHTSDEHAWFQSASKDRQSPYRDFYVWREGVKDAPPSDLVSIFGGSAWEYNAPTGDYYLHMFSRRQPDLNWHNPAVRAEIYKVIRFWMDKGVGGFRIDTLDMIGKDVDAGRIYETEETHAYIREMNRETFGPSGLLTVGETSSADLDSALRYASIDGKEISMIFQFEHVHLDRAAVRDKWPIVGLDFLRFKQVMSRWQTLQGKAWTSLYLNNHDQPRALSRWGNDSSYRVRCAKMMATMLHTMWGTPFIYQGEEIGMTNAEFDRIDDYRDLDSLRAWREMLDKGVQEDEVMRRLKAKSRDNARTPMQWNDERGAGFTSGEPWIGINQNHRYINARQDIADPDGIFGYYQKLVQLRGEESLLVQGQYELLLPDDPEIFVFLRRGEQASLLTVCNFYGGRPHFNWPQGINMDSMQLLLSNMPDAPINQTGFVLNPYEARVYKF